MVRREGASMHAKAVGESALQFMPKRRTLPAMRRAAQGCRGCPLFLRATQAVFGEGAARARAMLVGEQPGHDEDLAGTPFVGPAGRILDRALEAAGIVRSDTYVTNVVKHFKWEPRGKRRLHKKPGAREIAACLPWLQAEIELVQPRIVICLGATAAQALLGRAFRVSVEHGRVRDTEAFGRVMATIHPASILRQRTEEDRHREMSRFVEDLQGAAALLKRVRTV